MICTAKTSSGKPCRAPAISGGAVCQAHGGSAPQVRAAARERILALVDPSLAQLSKLIRHRNGSTSLGAVKDVLDRAGLKPGESLEITGPDGQPLLPSITVAFVAAPLGDYKRHYSKLEPATPEVDNSTPDNTPDDA